MDSAEESLDLTVDFKSYQERVTEALVGTTRTAGQISSQDLNFHRSSSAKVSRAIDDQNTRILQLTNRLLTAATKDTNVKTPKVGSHDDIEDKWHGIVDVFDDLLEKADASLDEFSGAIRRMSPSLQDGSNTPPFQKERAKAPHLFHNASMRKPQLDFHRRVNNYDTTPFKPLLQRKPHAILPLHQSIGNGESGKYDHPYLHEIEQYKYPTATYTFAPPRPYPPPASNQPVFVDSAEALQSMLSELKQAEEIAIDLEHHDMHSYIGIVCLMQISTREKDWIVDTLKPWREELQILNHVFADPSILKVFHGSNMDMIWLQRDLGLYVVGLFDTYHACVALNFPGKGLGYLLDRFVNFKAEKQYQRADWRVRPLPPALINYARSDTHYLLFIYDHLRNMLVEGSTPNENLVDQVLEASKREALQIYERPLYDDETGLGSAGWFRLLIQRSIRLDNQQFAVFRAIHKWRDQKAREADEGEQYLFPARDLWTLAEQMPMSMPDLHRTLRPVTPFIRANSSEILEIIKQAKIDGITGPSVHELMKKNEGKVGATPVWKRRSRRNSNEGLTGVGSTLQMLKEASGVSPSPAPVASSEQEVAAGRTKFSQLWGPTVPQIEVSTNTSIRTAGAALQSVLPLPPIATSTFSNDAATRPVAITTAAVPITPTQAEQDPMQLENKPDDIFVIREHNQSKKRKASTEISAPDLPPMAHHPGQYSLSTTTNGSLAQPFDPIMQERIRRQQKQQRKSEKQRRKAEQIAGQAVQQAPIPAEGAFDYESAPSLLHGQADEQVTPKAKAKPMNASSKALDTSTGAKRSKQGKEQVGRSITFKS